MFDLIDAQFNQTQTINSMEWSIRILIHSCQIIEYQTERRCRNQKTLLSTKYHEANCYAVKQVLETFFFLYKSKPNSFAYDNHPKQV